MFEHQLIDLAVADRRHIVLPEGEDDRILRAADILLRRSVADLTLLGRARAGPGAGGELGVDLARRAAAQPVRRRSCASGSPRSTTSAAPTRGSTSSAPATSSSTSPTSAR